MNKLKKFLNNTERSIRIAFKKEPAMGQMYFGAISSVNDTPCIKEVRNKDYIYYGEDNLYPQKLKEATSGSPIHAAIVKTKAMMTAGDGYLINKANNEEQSKANYQALDPNTKLLYDEFTKNELDKDDIHGVNLKMAYDLHRYGAFAYERIWNNDHTRIVRVKRVKVENLRSGKYVRDKIQKYYHSRDWSKINQVNFKPTELYTPSDNENVKYTSELIYETVGDLDYYGEPPYKEAITWIQTDAQMGLYHYSNIFNGMNPSMFIKFYQMFRDEKDKQDILDGVRKNYTGAKNTGKVLYSFTEGKENAPDITPVPTTGLDKQQIVLAELCDRKILTGHQLTNPLLVGISISGQLGGNVEIEKSYNIFDNVVMSSYRSLISKSLKKHVLDVNGIKIDWEIAPYNPFKTKDHVVAAPKPEPTPTSPAP